MFSISKMYALKPYKMTLEVTTQTSFQERRLSPRWPVFHNRLQRQLRDSAREALFLLFCKDQLREGVFAPACQQHVPWKTLLVKKKIPQQRFLFRFT